MERVAVSAALLGIAAVVLASGCSASSPSPATPSPSWFPSSPSVVAIGDSVPYNARHLCPGCTGFVNSYTGALSEREGEPYAAVNRSRIDGAQTVDVLEEVQSGSLDAVLSEAEVIIVSVGANDLPPYREGDCSDAAIDLHDVESAAVALAATTEECIATHTAAAGANLASLLESVREVAPDASILALTAYNAWTGWPLLDALGPAVAGPVSQVVVASTDAWRAEVCEKAEDVGGECVDLLAAFNGADGLTPAGDLLAADYGHPSQEGHDLIRDLLLEH